MFIQNLPKKLALNLLHHHVRLAGPVAIEDPHHPGMVQPLPYLLFAFKTVVDSRMAFYLGMREFDRHHSSGGDIGGAEDGGHTAAGNQMFDAVVIESFAGME
jgi:hypothetical protein